MKALFHIDERHKWPLLSMNVKNILQASPNMEVAVVINSEAVELFIKSTVKLEPNVKYYICENSLVTRNLNPRELLQGTELTKSGVYQIVFLQNQGFAYIKP